MVCFLVLTSDPFGCAVLRPRRGEEGFGIHGFETSTPVTASDLDSTHSDIVRASRFSRLSSCQRVYLNCIWGMSCDHGYTLRQCEAEPHLFVDGDSIKFVGVRNSDSRTRKRVPSDG